jgi:hypothetical protein
MPIFAVQVFKTHPLNGSREWSNVYHVRCGTSLIAIGIAGEIVTAEKAFHNVSTTFTRARASSITPGDDDFQTQVYNEPGERTDPSQNYPLWDTVRVDITVVGGGRPSRKFYRLPLGETDVVNLVVDGTLRSTIDTALEALRVSLDTATTPLVDLDDQEWQDVAAAPNVQMRQLHRKRKRSA